MSVVFPEPAMPITMHAVGWRVVASAALDEAAAGDETVAVAIVAVAACGADAAGWTPNELPPVAVYLPHSAPDDLLSYLHGSGLSLSIDRFSEQCVAMVFT